MAALGAAAAQMVFSSSCTVYGNPEKVPIDEDHPLKVGPSPPTLGAPFVPLFQGAEEGFQGSADARVSEYAFGVRLSRAVKFSHCA